MASTAIRSAVATGDAGGPATRTRLVNIDNGGTLTDICVIDGDEVRYTKTLTTPFDLSRCLFDGLAKVSGVVYGEERLGPLLQTTDYIRYSTTHGTNALVQRKGRRLGLLVTDDALPGRLAATPEQEELLDALVGDRRATVSLGADDDALAAELVRSINALASNGASRIVVSIGGDDGAATETRLKHLLLKLYPRPGALAGADAYRPVLNVAAHYAWPVWVRSDRAPAWPGGAVEGVAGWLGSEPPAQPAGSWGLVAEGWLEAVPLPEVDGGAVVAVVPAEADPDAVMARVREIG